MVFIFYGPQVEFTRRKIFSYILKNGYIYLPLEINKQWNSSLMFYGLA